MPRALVTGAAGFLGSHLSERLLDEGYSVIGMDNLVTGDLANIAHLTGRDFVFVKHDVTNYINIDGPVDWIFHFASPASPIDYLKLPIQTLKVGSLGTHNTLGLARAKGARILLASTSEVYGDPLVHPQREDYWGNVNPVGPRGVYDEAKRFAEAMVMAYHRAHGLETRIVRIFNTYGPRMRVEDGRAIPAFLSQALRGEDLTVFGDGTQTRSLCYRERPRRWHLPPDGLSRGAAGQHRQLRRDDDSGTGREDRGAHRFQEPHRGEGRCPSTIRRFASPTSRGHGRSWDGSLASGSPRDSTARSPTSRANWASPERRQQQLQSTGGAGAWGEGWVPAVQT